MGVLATDDFNRANGDVGANWTALPGFFAGSKPLIVSNEVVETVNRKGAFYNAVSWPDDQYSQVVIRQFRVQVVVRAALASGEWDGYFVDVSTTSTTFNIFKKPNNAAVTALDSGGTATLSSAPVSGDVIRLEVEGTTLRAYINDVLECTGTDNDFASGSAGMGVGNISGDKLDDWEGGDFSGGGVSGTFYNQAGPGTITASGSAETVQVDNGMGSVTLDGSAGTFPVDNGVGYFVLA